MKKEILSEIYRIQEIMGQKKIINETSIPFKNFAKVITSGLDAELTAVIKKELADFATNASKSVDTVYDDFINELKVAATDEDIEKIINKYLRSDIGESGITRILDNVLNSNPEIYVKIALESNFTETQLAIFQKIINSKSVTYDVAFPQFELLKKRVEELMTSDDTSLQQMGQKIKKSELYQKLNNKIDNLKNEKAESAQKAEGIKTAINKEEQIDGVIDYLKKNASTSEKVKQLIKDGKYGNFKSRLSKLEELLKDETSLKDYLGETKYENFKLELEDFQRQKVNILSRFGIKAGPWMSKHPWWSGLILLASVCLLNGIFEFTELGIGPAIGEVLSEIWIGFKGPNDASQSDEQKTSSSNTNTPKTLDDFKNFIKGNWKNDAPTNEDAYVEVATGKVYNVKVDGDNYFYDVVDGNFVYRKPG